MAVSLVHEAHAEQQAAERDEGDDPVSHFQQEDVEDEELGDWDCKQGYSGKPYTAVSAGNARADCCHRVERPKHGQGEVHCVLVVSAGADAEAVEVVIDLLAEHPQGDGVGGYQDAQEEDVFVFAQVGPAAPEPDGERGEQAEHEREGEESDVEHGREVSGSI